MPLTMVKAGEATTIRKIGGKEDTKRFLVDEALQELAQA